VVVDLKEQDIAPISSLMFYIETSTRIYVTLVRNN